MLEGATHPDLKKALRAMPTVACVVV